MMQNHSRRIADWRAIGSFSSPLVRTLEEPGDLGQQVGAAAGELSRRSHRGGFLVFGQLTPLSAMARLPRQLGDEEPVSLRPLIDHVF